MFFRHCTVRASGLSLRNSSDGDDSLAVSCPCQPVSTKIVGGLPGLRLRPQELLVEKAEAEWSYRSEVDFDIAIAGKVYA